MFQDAHCSHPVPKLKTLLPDGQLGMSTALSEEEVIGFFSHDREAVLSSRRSRNPCSSLSKLSPWAKANLQEAPISALSSLVTKSYIDSPCQ